MKKKVLAAILAGTTIMTTIAGCSGNTSTETSKPESIQTESTQSGDTSSVTTNESEQEEVTIKFIYYADDTQKEIVEAACDEYEATHPGIIISTEVIPADGTINTLIPTLAASGDLPDVSYLGEAEVIKYADKGILYSLDDAISEGTIAKKLDAVTIRGVDGKIYGLGLSNQLELMYYNKDIFDEAGLDYPPSNVEDAWTWEEFVDTAKKLTVDVNGKHPDEDGFNQSQVDQYGVAFNSMYQFHYMWAAYANGGGIVSADGSEFLWNQEKSLEGIQKIANLFFVDMVAPAATSSLVSSIGSADKAMISGDVAMYINGSWDLASVINAKTDAGVNYGVAVLPKMENAVTMNAGGPMVMYNTTEHPEEVLEFYSYMIDPERVIDIIKTGAWLPNEEDWYTDEEKIALWTSGENITDEAKEVIISYSTTEGAIAQWPTYYVPGWAEMMSISDSVMDSVWNGTNSVEDALSNVMEDIRTKFDLGAENFE